MEVITKSPVSFMTQTVFYIYSNIKALVSSFYNPFYDGCNMRLCNLFLHRDVENYCNVG